MPKDVYKTIKEPTPEVLFKDKQSKFYGYAFPISNEDDVKVALENLKQTHKSANHFCYAYQIGVNDIYYRVNDDGEPNNSAGLPIYGQIQSFNLTNILIVVVRYFGGTKLGVGGLINAYRSTATLSIKAALITKQYVLKKYNALFEYNQLSAVMRLVKEHKYTIEEQEMHLKCNLTISVRQNKAKELELNFKALHLVDLKPI